MLKKKLALKVEVPKAHRNPAFKDGVLEIDFSAISTYLRCGQQFNFRYIQGIKSPPKVALIEGSSHHHALERHNLLKINGMPGLKPLALTETFMENFRLRVLEAKDQLDWEEESEDKIFGRAKTLHQRYISDVDGLIIPKTAEKEFELPIKGKTVSFKLYGTTDLTEETGVWDYKTRARALSANEVDQSLQLAYYSLAEKKDRAGIIALVKTANPYVICMRSMVSTARKDWAIHVAEAVVNAVLKESFPYTDTTNWWCSEKFCGYWKLCRGKEN